MSLGEFDIIARYFTRRSRRTDVLLGVGDDAAVLQMPSDRRLVAAVDTIVQDIHFPRGTAAGDVGYRALAVNISDIAAMGAVPVWFTLSLSMPTADADWIAKFAAGMFALADAYDMELVGGDTVKGPLVITIQIFGLVETDRWLTRSGGKPGDLVYVSGVPGEAAVGLALVQHKLDPSDITSSTLLQQKFLRPQPRVALGRRLRVCASAAQDVSDGLLTDLSKLCAASACGAHVDLDALPRSAAMNSLLARETQEPFILGGGDDYELLFTVPPAQVPQVEVTIANEVRCTSIGHLVEEKNVRCFRGAQEVQTIASGFDHFR